VKQIYKKNLSVAYHSQGKGLCIILIHGFMETHEIWSGFADSLSEHYHVISVDLPGHGLSDPIDKPWQLEKYAEAVYDIIIEEKIEKTIMIGHSMGGYVTLAFAEAYPEKLIGIGLFHSTPFADSEEKKIARYKTIENIEAGKLNEIINRHFIDVYNHKNRHLFSKEIERAKKAAYLLSRNAVIASITAMAERKDRSGLLGELKIPALLIVGTEDTFIPKTLVEQIILPPNSQTSILWDSGHMGMIEEKEKSLKAIISFIRNKIRG
jgi:pimeloyl-ACP methyl ester carboxylesterase